MDLLRPLLPWLLLLVLFCVFGKLYGWARRRKTGAFVFGALTQMLLPDPYAERTLKIVQERKQESRREQDENGDRTTDEQQEFGTPAPDTQPNPCTSHDTQQAHDSGRR